MKMKENRKFKEISKKRIFQQHTGRVFRLQFDDFQIVSSSHDDTILIWDFLDATPGEKTDFPFSFCSFK